VLDVLVVAPHPDDAELGLAGTIMKLRDEGYRVGVLDLTNGEPTPRGSLAIRARETAAATKVLGIEWRENLGLPNRSLEASLDARRRLAEVIRRVRPRVLLAPYWEDAHPDHVATTQLVEAARFWAKLSKSDLAGEPFHPQRVLYYYCVHLRLLAQPALVVDISAYWERKRAAIACYESQFASDGEEGSPTLLDQLRDQAAYWGWSIGAAYGEPIASREAIGVTNLRGII
jgi:bacillithiol biosynthesis deacetylase BshB1